MAGTLYITGDKAADKLLNTDANALLIGMLLDQQVPMEWAFAGPATLKARLGHLDPKKIAAMDVDDFVSICCEKPAIHRFPGSMGKRIHAVCEALSPTTRATPRTSGRASTTPTRCTGACAHCPATATRRRRSSSRSSANA
jgi:uncharacterized HhH-GPD family protein